MILPATVALGAFPVAAVTVLFPRARAVAAGIAIASVTSLVLVAAGLWCGWELRELGFARLARASAPLVAAIRDYELQHGQPPTELSELPTEVRMGLPAFELVVGDVARERFDGNPWVLTLDTSTGLINWDQFIYYPLQNYPDTGHGGWLTRIEDWAYVNE